MWTDDNGFHYRNRHPGLRDIGRSFRKLLPSSAKDWRAKGLLIVGCVLASVIAAQYYINYELAAPRTLNDKQMRRIATQMRQFAGVQYDASVPEGDPEAQDLLPLVEKSLDDAGWKEVNCAFATLVFRRDNKPGVCVRSGTKHVTVAFAQGRASQLEHIASALATALTAEGISASFGSGDVSYQIDAIHVLIGRKT
jgi:hypothetical protein